MMKGLILKRNVWLILIAVFLGLAGYWLISSRMPASINLQAPASVQVNQTLEVPLQINSEQPMNAAEFYFQFPVDLLQIKEIKTDGSLFELWITGYPKYSNQDGTIGLAGGLPTPGWQGKQGLIATVIFEAKRSGQAIINLDKERSRILANDSLGTKIEASYRPTRITVK